MSYYMKRKLIGIAAILVFAILTGCSSKANTAMDAPNFTLRSIAGKEISLRDYKGKVVLLDFWATWCPPCRSSIPELTKLQNKYRNKGLVVLGICLDKPYQANNVQLKRFMKKYNMNYPVMRGGESIIKKYFGDSLMAIPTLHVINQEGKIVKTIVGFTPGAAEKAVQHLL